MRASATGVPGALLRRARRTARRTTGLSGRRQRPAYVASVEELGALLGRKDPRVVSVDFFDTLVTRDCFDPVTVFRRMVDCGTGRELGLDEAWIGLRRSTEHALVARPPHEDTTLAEIYDGLAARLAWDAPTRDRALALELSEERRSWRPNRPLVALLETLRQQGTTVLVCSDTYLPSSALREALAGTLLADVAVEVSSETGVAKRSGAAFVRLQELYGRVGLVHVGDNDTSDGSRAAARGVDAVILGGPGRLASSLTWEAQELAHRRGVERLPAVLVDAVSDGGSTGVAALALSWGLVVEMLLARVEEDAARFGIDAVWFTSRDCESMFEVVRDRRRSPGAEEGLPPVRYVYFSRRSITPLLQDQDRSAAAGPVRRYIDEQVAASVGSADLGRSPRILLVDVGWSGTLLGCLQRAVPGVEWFSTFLSLVPGSATSTGTSSQLIAYDAGRLNRPMAEMLFGFLGDTCTGYAPQPGSEELVPTFGPAGADRSDAAYTVLLRGVLTELLARPGRPATTVATRELCADLVERLLVYPRREDVRDLDGWSFASDTTGGALPVLGTSAGTARVLSGTYAADNVWPSGALARRVTDRRVAYVLQVLGACRRSLSSPGAERAAVLRRQAARLGFPVGARR